jgi:aminopeptidase-like protein
VSTSAGDGLDLGSWMVALAADLFPICRSLTGDGVRATLRRIQREIPLELHEVPTGTRVLDWEIPNEWTIRDAYIARRSGERVIDFRECNLHVVGHSMPVRRRMTLAELRPHLHALPDRPDWIPYRTSFFADRWGFCLSQRQLDALTDDEYDVAIDATLAQGHLTYGEYVVPGDSDAEVLISAHCCHPSLANDNLSGMVLAAALGKWAAKRAAAGPGRLGYRFVFAPATLGAISWLARNRQQLSRIRHGLVLTCVGDAGALTYKQSRQGDAAIDRAMRHVIGMSAEGGRIRSFTPLGYDERQFCSPGFDLPVGCLMRTPNAEYPEYHTSADNVALLSPASLSNSFETVVRALDVLETDAVFQNVSPYGEPQLGRRGLYRGVGPGGRLSLNDEAVLWVLNLSDGRHSILDIAERASIPYSDVRSAATALTSAGLLEPVTA